MAIRNKFTLSSDNKKFMTLFDWVATLSVEEQEQFCLADQRQVKHRQNAIDRGDMIIDPVTKDYVWKNKNASLRNKPTDDIWIEFWHQYVVECNINFESTFKEE